MDSKNVAASLGLFLTVTASACSRNQPTVEPAVESPSASGTRNNATAPFAHIPSGAVRIAAANPAVAAVVPAGPAASGPRAEMNGEHYALVAAIAAPTAVPGDTSLLVEVHGGPGYHVNQLYPIALDLTSQNATAPAVLHRTDASQLTQQVASFRVPVHVTGGGATVRGNMRFAVCSDENCVPQQQAFAVALP